MSTRTGRGGIIVWQLLLIDCYVLNKPVSHLDEWKRWHLCHFKYAHLPAQYIRYKSIHKFANFSSVEKLHPDKMFYINKSQQSAYRVKQLYPYAGGGACKDFGRIVSASSWLSFTGRGGI
jgi:hypothetical protein